MLSLFLETGNTAFGNNGREQSQAGGETSPVGALPATYSWMWSIGNSGPSPDA